MSVKEAVLLRVSGLPNDASMADIRCEVERVAICEAIEQGQNAVRHGRIKSQTATAELYREWVGK